jgi:HPt (histidine-containing phosphotransfer) domain-containing protein
MQTNHAIKSQTYGLRQNTGEPVDFCDDALRDLRRHDLRAASKLYQYALQIYLADSGPLLNRIATGIATQSYAQVRQAAHTLKSNSLLVGALRVGRMAGTIESHAHQETGLTTAMAEELATLSEIANEAIAQRLRSPPN